VVFKKKVMKRLLGCTGILLLLTTVAQSQTKSGRTKTKQAVQSQNSSANKIKAQATNKQKAAFPNTITLDTATSYTAKAPAVLSLRETNYTIADPILTTLDKRASGANIKFNNSGIIGMPKRAYGFANGHITLSTTGAVTSGTQTGSGAVATGTSLGTFGSIGSSMNVNGKSPYAGINMWGNAMNMMVTQRDSSVRLTPLKKPLIFHN